MFIHVMMDEQHKKSKCYKEQTLSIDDRKLLRVNHVSKKTEPWQDIKALIDKKVSNMLSLKVSFTTEKVCLRVNK